MYLMKEISGTWYRERCKILIQHCLDSRFSSRYLVISINIGITYFSFTKILFSWKYISLYSSFFHRFFLSLCNKQYITQVNIVNRKIRQVEPLKLFTFMFIFIPLCLLCFIFLLCRYIFREIILLQQVLQFSLR